MGSTSQGFTSSSQGTFFPSPMVPNCPQGAFQADGQEVLWEEVTSLGAGCQSPYDQLQHVETPPSMTLEPHSLERGEEKEEDLSGKVDQGSWAPAWPITATLCSLIRSSIQED